VSADGRYVAFTSVDPDLVPGDTNDVSDAFIRNVVTGVLERASLGAVGEQGALDSTVTDISADGRYVLFQSASPNFVAGDTNETADVFVRDREAATTVRASIAGTGVEGNDASGPSRISGDGHRIVYRSIATNLVPGDTNGAADIFVRYLETATTERVSVDSSEQQASGSPRGSSAPAIARDGGSVAFVSEMTNLVAGDTNAISDIFVRDLQVGTTARVSVDSGESQASGPAGNAQPALSDGGRFVTFASNAPNLVPSDTNGQHGQLGIDVFVRDRQLGTTERVSVDSNEGQGSTSRFSVIFPSPTVSADGRYVAFSTDMVNLVAGDTNDVEDVFVRDRATGTTSRASAGPFGQQGDDRSNDAEITRDGRYVVFASLADTFAAPGVPSYGVYMRPNPLPVVTGASPVMAARGTSTTITVTGTSFLPGVTASFGDGITLTAVDHTDESTVRFTITVAPGAAPGARAVLVRLPGAAAGPQTGAAGGFTLTIA